MATGEKRFNSAERAVVKQDFKPFAAGEYDLKLNNDWEIKTAEGQGKLPYLNGSFEVIGTSQSEGSKNRKLYARFFLDLSPAKDGVSMVDRGNGLTAFAKGVGATLEVPVLQKPKGEEMVPTDILAPKATLAWIQALDGSVARARVKIEKGTGGYSDKNVVDYFVEAEEQQEVEAEVAAEEEAEEENAEAEGEVEAEEEAPPAKKAAPKLKAVAGKRR